MKRLKVFYVICILAISILLNGEYKVDPLFLAEFSESLGIQINTNYYKNTKVFPNIKWQDNVVSFDTVLPIYNDTLIEVIVSTYNNYTNNITYPVFLNDTLISGYLSYNNILQFSQENDINYIYISKPMFQSNDSAISYIGLDRINNFENYSENVFAGFIDNGFQSDLDIFKYHNSTRFYSIWNQMENNLLPPSDFFIGEEIDSNQILNYPTIDFNGHGTSVLASLASSDTLFPGVLRKSQIIGVNCELTSKSVAEGIKYIVNKAEQVDKPFVICMPLNHFWGTHDGNGPLDDVINYYFDNSKYNRAIVVPSGNLGNKYMHFSENNLLGNISDSIFSNKHVYIQCAGNNRTDIDLFINDTLYLRFITKSGDNLIYSDFIRIQDNNIGYYKDDFISFNYAYDELHKQVHIVFQYDKENILGLEFISNGYIDGYIAQGGYAIHTIDEENIIKGNNINSLAIPGFAKQAITTGAFVSRKYIDENIFTPDPIYSPLLWNGKARSSYYKPEVVAPGKYIITYSLYNPICFNHYNYFIGSSYSSAIAAGGIGIFLSIMGNINVENLFKYIYEGLQSNNNIFNDSIYCGTGILDIYSSYLHTGVMKKDVYYRFKLLNKNILQIEFQNTNKIISAKKINKKSNLIISNNKVLDKNINYGNNLYIIKFENMQNKIYEIKIEYFNNIDNVGIFSDTFDICGRKIKEIKKNGIYFYRENNKVKKIFKF